MEGITSFIRDDFNGELLRHQLSVFSTSLKSLKTDSTILKDHEITLHDILNHLRKIYASERIVNSDFASYKHDL